MAEGLHAGGLPRVTEGLRARGLSAEDVEALAGGSALRLIRAVLPSDADLASDARRSNADGRSW